MNPQELDAAIEDVLARPEFAWRLPRERLEDAGEGSILGDFFADLAEWLGNGLRTLMHGIEQAVQWLLDRLAIDPQPDGGDWQVRPQLLLFVALAIALSILAVALWRLWKRRRNTPTAVRPVRSLPDLADEDIVADQLPPDEWMHMAVDFLARGERRLAVRALFLSALAHLGAREQLTIARYKSNREYGAELSRRAHDRPELVGAFDRCVRLFERVWYGRHIPADAALSGFREDQALIANSGTAPRTPGGEAT